MPNEVTKEDLKQAFMLAYVVAAAVHQAGKEGIVSGHLYAMLCGKMTLEQYNGCIDLLKKQQLVKEENHVLTSLVPSTLEAALNIGLGTKPKA
jgi:hypothetical protein